MEDWEQDGFELFAPLRQTPLNLDGVEELVEKSVDRAKESIGAADFVEFATTVFVGEFLGPILDVFAFALGLEDEPSGSTEDSEFTENSMKDNSNG